VESGFKEEKLRQSVKTQRACHDASQRPLGRWEEASSSTLDTIRATNAKGKGKRVRTMNTARGRSATATTPLRLSWLGNRDCTLGKIKKSASAGREGQRNVDGEENVRGRGGQTKKKRVYKPQTGRVLFISQKKGRRTLVGRNSCWYHCRTSARRGREKKAAGLFRIKPLLRKGTKVSSPRERKGTSMAPSTKSHKKPCRYSVKRYHIK